MNTSQTQFYTYLHCRPDGSPFYVGKGVLKRCYDFSRRNEHHKRVVTKYGRENVQIVITKKDSEESAFKSEIRLIKMMRWAGFKLCNQTDGGEGLHGLVFSDEHKKKIGLANTGKKRTAAARANNSAAQLGKKLSPEHCAKIGAFWRGKVNSAATKEKRASSLKLCFADPAVKEKMSAWQRGRKLSPEHCENMSAAQTGKKLSTGHRAKISAAGLGKKHSLEARAKMSAANKGRKKSAAQVKKMSEVNKGKKLSPEHRANISAGLLARKIK